MSNQHPELGKLLTGGEQRDAIHIAIAPVVAAERLNPGDHIGFSEPGNCLKVAGNISSDRFIGIVDPFLPHPVQPGERFYMCLYPRTTQNLRHDWEHPAFIAANAARKLGANESEEWLRDYAENTLEVPYNDLIAAGHYLAKHGDWGELGVGHQDNDVPSAFWDHFEAVTGVHIPEAYRSDNQYIPCAC